MLNLLALAGTFASPFWKSRERTKICEDPFPWRDKLFRMEGLQLTAIRLGRSGYNHHRVGGQGVGNVICRRCTATFAVFAPKAL